MTHESRYSLVAAGKHSTKNLTLWEARKALMIARESGATADATHISRDGRCVAFFCEWENVVKAMFGALDQESHKLGVWKRSTLRGYAHMQ